MIEVLTKRKDNIVGPICYLIILDEIENGPSGPPIFVMKGLNDFHGTNVLKMYGNPN